MTKDQLEAAARNYVKQVRPAAVLHSADLTVAETPVEHYRVVEGTTDLTGWYPDAAIAWAHAAIEATQSELARLLY